LQSFGGGLGKLGIVAAIDESARIEAFCAQCAWRERSRTDHDHVSGA
jgi:hypothetical protein